ncbi:MAG: DUF1638 domain-containing protein [Thermoleophilia bacterium]
MKESTPSAHARRLSRPTAPGAAVILACEMIEDEVLLALKRTGRTTPLVWIPAGLHERPAELRAYLQDLVDRLDEGHANGTVVAVPSVRPGKGPVEPRAERVAVPPADEVLLALGYCGNGLQGLVSRRARLVFPRVDDCISLFLNHGCTREEICRDAHAFYFTRGWLCHDNPMLISYDAWRKRFGVEKARRLRKASMAAYRRITLIDTGAYSLEEFRPETESLAADLELDHTVVPGSIGLLERLFAGPWDSEVVVLPPGQEISIRHLFGPEF